MSTFNSPSDAAPLTKILSAGINNLDAATAAAFALLPDETKLKLGTVQHAVDSGAADAYVVTLTHAPAAYTDGMRISMRPANTNTGASTINVNSLGVKSIRRVDSTATPAGSIMVGVPVDMVYSSATGYFHIVGALGATGYTGTLPVGSGGTGQSSYTNGQLLIGNTTGNTLDKATLTEGANVTITNGAGAITIAAAGSVSTVSVASANGFAGTVANATSTPAITLTTTATGLLKGNGTAIAAAVSGTDIKTIASQSLVGSGDVALKTVNSTSLIGAGDIAIAGSVISRTARTSNTILANADRGKFFDVTSGTFSQTFEAAATLTDGWFCYYKNSGTGVVTLDPDGAELIDGAATVAVYQGETRLIQCTGTALTTVLTNGIGDHEVTVHTGNGHGAVNTKIRRFTTAMTNVGTAITYADHADNGASFTINETGLYSIAYCDVKTNGQAAHGISVNSAALTTSVESIPVATRPMLAKPAYDAGFYSIQPATIVVKLTAGDVVRPHTDGDVNWAGDSVNLSIRKIGYV